MMHSSTAHYLIIIFELQVSNKLQNSINAIQYLQFHDTNIYALDKKVIAKILSAKSKREKNVVLNRAQYSLLLMHSDK